MTRKLQDQVVTASCVLLLIAAGCSRNENVKKVDLTNTVEIKNMIDSPSSIRIGLIPEQNVRAMAQRYEPLADYLSQKMKQKVTLVYLNSYSEVCDRFIYKQLDAAFFGSFNYVLTHAKVGIEPIARPDYAGISVYRGLVLTRADSGIQNVSAMKGKRLALVHPVTYTGSLYPLQYFQAHGVTDVKSYFSSVVFTGSHDKAIMGVLTGQADVAIAKDTVYKRMVRENPALEKQLAMLAVSEPAPTNTLCVRKELPAAHKAKLKELLLNLDKDPNGALALEALDGASKFVEASDEDYQRIYAIAKALGIDVSTYPYHEKDDTGFSGVP